MGLMFFHGHSRGAFPVTLKAGRSGRGEAVPHLHGCDSRRGLLLTGSCCCLWVSCSSAPRDFMLQDPGCRSSPVRTGHAHGRDSQGAAGTMARCLRGPARPVCWTPWPKQVTLSLEVNGQENLPAQGIATCHVMRPGAAGHPNSWWLRQLPLQELTWGPWARAAAGLSGQSCVRVD